MRLDTLLLALLTFTLCTFPSWAWLSPDPQRPSFSLTASRRSVFSTAALVAATTVIAAPSANALVKGMSPPPTTKVGDTKPKCRNVEECQELAAQREQQDAAAASTPTLITKGGVRYLDFSTGTGREARNGDDVKVFFKVLKLGKRSYDGLSGEGTVVFSRGYALEDDEKVPGDKLFRTTVGSLNNIVALNEALVGMKEGGVRRFAVAPQQGWRKPGASCDGGPGGSGQGGDLKTDYVVVPTATMVEQEACFDKFKQPFPVRFDQQRRMAQRFDQSLIMEVELVSANVSTDGL